MDEYVKICGYLDIAEFSLEFSRYDAEGLKGCKKVFDPFQELKKDIEFRCGNGDENLDNFPFDEIDESEEDAFNEFIYKQIEIALEKEDFLKEVEFTEYDEDGCFGYDYIATLNLKYEDLYRKFKGE